MWPTTHRRRRNLRRQDAAGYTRFGLGPVTQAPKEGAGWLFGAADLAMRPDELALWDISLIDRSLLDANSYAAQRSPVVLADGSRRPYGLGLHIEAPTADSGSVTQAAAPASSPRIVCGPMNEPPSSS